MRMRTTNYQSPLRPGSEAPSQAQVAFYLAVINDWNRTFSRVSPMLVKRYEGFLRKPFPAVWSVALRPAGIGVPLGDQALGCGI